VGKNGFLANRLGRRLFCADAADDWNGHGAVKDLFGECFLGWKAPMRERAAIRQ